MTELTREAILAMPPGPELDVLIAEKVKGYVWLTRPVSMTRWLGPASDIGTDDDPMWGAIRAVEPDEMESLPPEHQDNDHPVPLPAYRTNKAAALSLLDVADWWRITKDSRYGEEETYCCEMQTKKNTRWEYAPTIELAICRTRLVLAVEA